MIKAQVVSESEYSLSNGGKIKKMYGWYKNFYYTSEWAYFDSGNNLIGFDWLLGQLFNKYGILME